MATAQPAGHAAPTAPGPRAHRAAYPAAACIDVARYRTARLRGSAAWPRCSVIPVAGCPRRPVGKPIDPDAEKLRACHVTADVRRYADCQGSGAARLAYSILTGRKRLPVTGRKRLLRVAGRALAGLSAISVAYS